jgi:hypothetical protein
MTAMNKVKVQKAAKPFKRIIDMLESLEISDGVPLRDAIPGLWPTVGDLRVLLREIGDAPPQ